MNNQELRAQVVRLESELRQLRSDVMENKVNMDCTINALTNGVAALESRLAALESR